MNFVQWLNHGIDNGYCTAIFCSTHDGAPLNSDEWQQFENGFDPCVFAVRITDVADHRTASKTNHPANRSSK